MFTKIRYHGFANADILSHICLLESTSQLFKYRLNLVVGLSVTWQSSIISKIKITYDIIEPVPPQRQENCEYQLILTNKASYMVVGCIQIETWYLTMLEHPSYLCLYRGFFPIAENTGCTPSAWYQPDCGGTLSNTVPGDFSFSFNKSCTCTLHTHLNDTIYFLAFWAALQ